MKKINSLLLNVTIFIAVSLQAQAQDMDSLAKNPKLFIEIATKYQKWNDYEVPQKIVGPIYFVGTKGLCAWLITTSEGLILLNTGMPPSGPMIEESIKKLGFKPDDIKYLLTCHGHIDHVGGHSYIKKISGAKVAIMEVEKDLLETGGKIDYFYGAYPDFWFEPVNVDRVLNDDDTIKLGEVIMIAHRTSGHSKGSTTWIMNAEEDGKTYNVVFPDGTGVNPGFRVAIDETYPGMGDDYLKTFAFLEQLNPDIWLASHAADFGFERKLSLVDAEGVNAWIDPDGYVKYLKVQREKFDAEVNKEIGK